MEPTARKSFIVRAVHWAQTHSLCLGLLLGITWIYAFLAVGKPSADIRRQGESRFLAGVEARKARIQEDKKLTLRERIARGWINESIGEGVEIKQLSWRPRLWYLKNWMEEGQGEVMIEMAKNRLGRSKVFGANATDGVGADRTSEGTFFVDRKTKWHPASVRFRRMAASLIGVPPTNLEDIQILRYKAGQQYLPHLDWFDPSLKEIMKRGGQRISTLLCWINHIPLEGGGGTAFPEANISIPAGKGDAIIWYNVDESGAGEFMAKHAGLPPADGYEKWVAIVWIHERAFV